MATELAVTRRLPAVAKRMADAATGFLATLDAPRLEAARFPFDVDERFSWNYRPDGFFWEGRTFWHEGLRLLNMTPPQREAALALLDTGLSLQGARRTRQIMALEADLRETERYTRFVPHVVRDPELYSFAVFGDPGGSAPWAWRVGGHHLGLHFTVVDGALVAPTPFFLGANPAEVRHGLHLGLRTLPEEEDLARDLLRSLDPDTRAAAVVSAEAPRDILTDAYRVANRVVPPIGASFAAMSGEQRERLVRLVRWYLGNTAAEIAGSAWEKIESAGLESITFAWAGPEEPGNGHYYAVRGSTFLIEYDNTQDGANHIHTVWRDWTGDWGEDLLAAHYAEAHTG